MKICPACGMPQLEERAVCLYCDYDSEKPISELSKAQIYKIMAPYEFDMTADGGCIIKSVKNIRDLALRGSVGVPHFVTEIGNGAYACCKFIVFPELPVGLRSIGENAFGGCRDLTTVFIPETVTHVGKAVFADCYDLAEIRCAAKEKPEGWDDAWLDGCDAKVKWGGGG